MRTTGTSWSTAGSAGSSTMKTPSRPPLTWASVLKWGWYQKVPACATVKV